jgi:hypothetical protein
MRRCIRLVFLISAFAATPALATEFYAAINAATESCHVVLVKPDEQGAIPWRTLCLVRRGDDCDEPTAGVRRRRKPVAPPLFWELRPPADVRLSVYPAAIPDDPPSSPRSRRYTCSF